MKPFELRLAEQHSRNARYIRNLTSFCEDEPRFNRLDVEDRDLLMKQLELMTSLDKVLEQRMRRLGIPV